MKKFIFAILFASALPVSAQIALPAPQGDDFIFFRADSATYDADKRMLRARGNVKITKTSPPGGGFEISGEDFILDLTNSYLTSSRPFLVEQGQNAVYSDGGSYNWEKKIGIVKGAKSQYGVWRVLKSKSAEIKDGVAVFKGAKITSCDEKNPHYSISASSVHIQPGRRLWGYNTLFYLGDVPVFYFPFIYRSLRTDRPYTTFIDLGYDERSGYQFKTSTVFDIGKNVKDTVYVDYFSRLGFGFGNEIELRKGEFSKVSAAGYTIRDNETDTTRWGLTGGGWYALKDSYNFTTGEGVLYYGQSQFRLVGDPFFNNDFFRSNPYAVTPDIQADVSFVRQTNKTTLRLSYIRREEKLEGDNFFTKTLEQAPRLDFYTAPFSILGLPFFNSFTAYFENREMDSEDGHFGQSLTARWTITKPFRLARGTSVLTKVFYDQSALLSQEDVAGIPQKDQWIGRYGGALTLRKSFDYFSLDLTQSYTRRLRPNTMRPAGGDNDYSIEENQTLLSAVVYPSQKLYFKLSSGYDYRNFRDTSVDAEDRWMPVFADLSYSFGDNYSLFAQNTYRVGAGNQNFLAGISKTDAGKLNSFSVAVSNTKTEPNVYYLDGKFSFTPEGKTWGADLAVKFKMDAEYGVSSDDFVMYSKELAFRKQFHDFDTLWGVQFRPGVKAFIVRASLKFGNSYKRTPIPGEERFNSPWENNN